MKNKMLTFALLFVIFAGAAIYFYNQLYFWPFVLCLACTAVAAYKAEAEIRTLTQHEDFHAGELLDDMNEAWKMN